MGPHPVPRWIFNGETGPVHVEKNPSILLLLLPGGAGAVVGGGGGGPLPGAAAEEAVRAGALGSAVPAQLGRGGAGPAGGVGSGHGSQRGTRRRRRRGWGGRSSPSYNSFSVLVSVGRFMLITANLEGTFKSVSKRLLRNKFTSQVSFCTTGTRKHLHKGCDVGRERQTKKG